MEFSSNLATIDASVGIFLVRSVILAPLPVLYSTISFIAVPTVSTSNSASCYLIIPIQAQKCYFTAVFLFINFAKDKNYLKIKPFF